ncbi:unnamed protein product [Phytophthora lilii]|uniref:Unnamed protein product n=1 Tax=Phytophthora lilii TaxID=2077276 RepID=A0A9W6WLQ5_9STRA|nr:unnamed protein product [Phytophthora lilii]
MEGDECAEREVPKARIETLVNTISQYKDVYPVLQRGVQFLGQELCDGGDDDEHCKEVTRFVEYFVKAGSLTDTVSAMLANLDSPAFISSCFELLIAMINNAEELMTFALEKSG